MHCRIKLEGQEEQGEVIVRGVVEHMEGGLVAFEKLWRQHFLDSMQPRHMPPLWSVDHSHDQLRDLENSVLSRTVLS
jgi:exonuclease 3'-5' domain-containing protein 2